MLSSFYCVANFSKPDEYIEKMHNEIMKNLMSTTK